MKRLITGLMLFPFLAIGQTRFGQLPTAMPDTNTSVIGLKKVAGVYSDYLFGVTQLMSYINSGIRGGTLQSVTDTGNTTTNSIQIGKGASLNPYSSVVLTMLADSSGVVKVKDTAGANSILMTTSDSAYLQMQSATGSPVTLSTNSGLQLGGGLPVTFTNGLYSDTVKCNILSANITDTFPGTSGTLALSGQVADTSSVLRGLITGAAMQTLQSVTGNGNTTPNSMYVTNSTGTTMAGLLNVGELMLSAFDSTQKVLIFPGASGAPSELVFSNGSYFSELKYTQSSSSSGYIWTLPSLTGTIALTSQLTGGTVTSVTAGAGLSGGTITTSGTISLPNVGTAGSYGSASVVPTFTTDAQGRISAVTLYTVTASVPTLQQVMTSGNSYTVGSGTVNFSSGSMQCLNSSGNNTVMAPTYLELINNSGANGITLQAANTCTVNSTVSVPVNVTGTLALTSQLGNIPHLIGATSTPSIVAGSAAGTSPSISITGTDLSGYITLTTGSSPADSAIVATITFNTAYSSAPVYVAISPANVRALGATDIYSPVPGDTNGATTTTFTIVTEATLTAATTYKFRYSVSQ